MNPWDIFAYITIVFLVMALFCFCMAFLLLMSMAIDDWRVEKRERLLKAEHRDAEL